MNPRSTNDGNDLNVTVLNNLNYVDAVIKEVLRVAPPVGAGYREALQTFEIDVRKIVLNYSRELLINVLALVVKQFGTCTINSERVWVLLIII